MATTTKRIKGMASVQLGVIESDGGFSTVLSAFGDTVRDSVTVTADAPSTTDIFVEESEDAIESLQTTKGATKVAFATFNTDPAVLVTLFGGINQPAGSGTGLLNAAGTLTGGTGYVPGTYTNVPLTGGTGTGARATIVVNSSGVVTSVTKTHPGSGYTAADSLSAANTNLGGSGTGFSQVYSSVTTGAATANTWIPPATQVSKELSVQITDSVGNVFKATRVQILPTLALDFKRSDVGKISVSGTILTPSKAGEPLFSLAKAAA